MHRLDSLDRLDAIETDTAGTRRSANIAEYNERLLISAGMVRPGTTPPPSGFSGVERCIMDDKMY